MIPIRIYREFAMKTAIDSSVLIDLVIDDPKYADSSERLLRQARSEGGLVVCEVVLAEISPVLSATDVPAFLESLGIQFEPSNFESSLLAGEMFRKYLKRKRSEGRRRTVPDFLIGAHALTFCDRLLARDRGFFRDYFKGLEVLSE